MKKPDGKHEEGLTADQQKAVLDAALSVLSKGGLSATIVEKVAERCTIAAPRIFLHFGGTERLLEAILQRQLDLIAGSVTVPELRFPGETLRDELEGLARIIIEVCRNHIGVLRAMLAEALRSQEFAEVFYRTFILRGRQLFDEFLSERKTRGELRADLDIDTAAASYLTSLIMSLVLIELFGGKWVEKVDDERLAKGMTDLFLRGVLPQADSERARQAESV
jgi:AcrR family transcriptional regulator